jgi:ribosomal-protein-alanine N-acetyltransferase
MLPHVVLRPITPEDWSAVHAWAATEAACRYQPWGPNTPSQTQSFVRTAAAAWLEAPQSRFVWIAESSGETVGLGELKIRSTAHQQGEISYAVHVERWRRGFGTAIATGLLDLAFGSLELHRVEATCDPRNHASAAVLRRVGMTYEGRLWETIGLRDGWRDSDVFGILATEWVSGPLRSTSSLTVPSSVHDVEG